MNEKRTIEKENQVETDLGAPSPRSSSKRKSARTVRIDLMFMLAFFSSRRKPTIGATIGQGLPRNLFQPQEQGKLWPAAVRKNQIKDEHPPESTRDAVRPGPI
jgi:hypothetical protein